MACNDIIWPIAKGLSKEKELKRAERAFHEQQLDVKENISNITWYNV